MRLFDETVAQYLTDNTMSSVGMAASGGQGGGEHTDGDTYASGDARLPNVKVKLRRKRKLKKN